MVRFRNKKMVVLLFLLLSISAHAYDINDDLIALESVLSQREQYVESKINRIQRLELEIRANTSLIQKYNLCTNLFEEFESFQFDRALETLDMQEKIAQKLANKSDYLDLCNLRRARLYCKGAFYKESEKIVEKIDTSTLSREAMLMWYSLKSSLSGTPKPYREDYLALSSEHSFDYEYMSMLNYLDSDDLQNAQKGCETIINAYAHNTKEYAKAAYYLGVIYDRKGDFNACVHWYCESAKSDAFSAVKDHAALYSIALSLIHHDMYVEKAFAYTQKALEDAVYFNANLRLNQIVRTLPSIEAAYAKDRRKSEITMRVFNMLIISLFGILLIFIITHLKNHAKLKKTLSDLCEANEAKEEFLALYLSMSSKYLDKLRPFLSRSQMDAELKNFYNAFDTAVLQLYPNFVQDFNNLLLPEYRITLKKGEVLNTELRIFALILFGVTQSSHIASLLRYSVNTIYNYRAQLKAHAIDTKTPFEQQIKDIRGFN